MKLIFVLFHSPRVQNIISNFRNFLASLNIFLKTFCEDLNQNLFLATTFPGFDTFSTSVNLRYAFDKRQGLNLAVLCSEKPFFTVIFKF